MPPLVLRQPVQRTMNTSYLTCMGSVRLNSTILPTVWILFIQSYFSAAVWKVGAVTKLGSWPLV